MILIRPYKEADHNFICSSYINSSYFNSMDKSTRMIKKIDHDRAMDRKINEMITQSLVMVAVPEEDPDLIAGFIIFTYDCAHYLYVKQNFRNMGVASELFKKSELPRTGLIVSHINARALDMMGYLTIKYEFNPFKIQF